jgi:uncharacterized protein (TIGR02217 family)
MPDIGILPRLIGQGWSVSKAWTWQSRIQRAASGRELRTLDYPFPLCQFSLVYEVIGQNFPGMPAQDYNNLVGFVGACQGAFGTFLYDDPTDNTAVRQFIGNGDGVTTQFQLQRLVAPLQPWGPGPGFTDLVTAPKAVTAIYYNGAQTGHGGNADAATGIITFGAPPPLGVQITADFTFYFRCRFMSDSYAFENFMKGLWSLKRLDFITVRA